MDPSPTSRPAVSGHADPAGEPPWAMQLVVRAEKADLPTRTAVCEATAMAVVRLLAADEAADAWQPAIARWTAGRIRKHCRRARGSKWHRVQDLPGVTVEHAGAAVRAFVPCPTDEVPPELARLQLSGLVLDDPDPRRDCDPATAGLVVVSLPPEPRLGDGKAAAAAGHAAQLAWMQAPAGLRDMWTAAEFGVRVEQPDAARFDRLMSTAPIVVRDAGFTEVEPGTVTAVARWA